MALLLGLASIQYQLRAPHFSLPRKPDYLYYEVKVNLLPLTTVPTQAPFSQDDWPNPVIAKQPLREWSWSYNLNLIGKDRLPTGTRVYDRPQLDVLQTVRSWVWNYNLNLIGKDQLPTGEAIYDRPPLGPLQPALGFTYSIDINIARGFPVGEFFTDLPPRPYPPPAPSWLYTSFPYYPPIIIGAEQLRAPHFSLPRAPLRLEYEIPLNFAILRAVVVQAPFRQTDWPNPLDYLRPPPSWTASFNLNLIGKDIVPGKTIYDLPPRDYQRSPPSWAAWYNYNLIGQDKLPPGADITDLPPRDYERAIQLRTWIQALNLALTQAPPTIPPGR